MPHSASARKRHRQNLRNRERNRAVKSSLKTAVRRLLDSLSQNDSEAVLEKFGSPRSGAATRSLPASESIGQWAAQDSNL